VATTTRMTLLLHTTTNPGGLDMASREADMAPMKVGDLVSGLGRLVVQRLRMELDAWQILVTRRATDGVTGVVGVGITERAARGLQAARAFPLRATRAQVLARLLDDRETDL
jgi:hypothetical protein